MRIVTGIANWGLCAALLLLPAGCAASTPVAPVAETPAPPPRATVFPAATSSPLPVPAPPAGPTIPTPVGPQPVREAGTTSALLQAMVRFAEQLQGLLIRVPADNDVAAATQQMSDILALVGQNSGSMSETQRLQAYWQANYLLDLTARVIAIYVGGKGEAGPSVAGSTPVPTSGAPLAILPGALPLEPPSGLPTQAQQLQDQIGLIQQHATQLASGRPTGDEVVVLTLSLQSSVTTIYQMTSLLPPQELGRLAGSAAIAMQEIARAARVYSTQ